jgi:O-antigen ligase
VRPCIAAVLSFLAFATSLLFQGPGVNLILLWFTTGFLLLAVTTLGARSTFTTLFASGLAGLIALFALAYFVLSYQLITLSKDSSFAPTWVLGSYIAAFAIVLSLRGTEHTVRLERVVLATVTMLASISVFRFLVFGTRAHEPLIDPNNYGAVLYFVWIVFAHRLHVASWRGKKLPTLRLVAVMGVSLVLLLAIFATWSRACVVVVACATILWLIIAVARRLPLWSVLLHAAIALVAYVVVVLAYPEVIDKVSASRVEAGLEIRVELLRAAWTMFVDRPVGGIGLFCFGLFYPMLRSPLEQETAGLFVHNDYAQLLAEGGIPLFAILVAWVTGMIAIFWRAVRHPIESDRFAYSGLAIASLACFSHAMVNFVLYSLPVGILVASATALLVKTKASPNDLSRPRWVSVTSVSTIAFCWIAWVYLALDVEIYGAFQGSRGVPGATWIRQNEERQLEFARFAQRMNADRGLPHLAEAMILRQRLERDPNSEYLLHQTAGSFAHAEASDPWNPLVYVESARFVEMFPKAHYKETSENLLLKALTLDPLYGPAIDALLARYSQRGEEKKAFVLLTSVVFPWLPLLDLRNEELSARYLAEIDRYASRFGDAEFLERLAQMRGQLVGDG